MLADASFAQTYRDAGGSVVPGVVVVGGSGSGPLFTSSNPGQIAGSFSATLSGFQPTPSYSYQSVTTASTAYALPTGAVVIFYNTGANPINVKLGASGVSVAPGQADVIQPNAWMAFTVGSSAYYAVVSNGGPSTVVASGGIGLPTGGGGGGGGSGGTVAQGSAAAASNAWPVSETVAGSIVSSSNPVPMTFGSGVMLPGFAATPTVNLGALNGAALDSSVQAVKTALGSPFQAGGSIANTSFGISGNLPAFAATPTFNVGTIPAVVLAAGSNAIGSVTVTSLPSLAAGTNTIGAISNTSFGANQGTPAVVANAWPVYPTIGGSAVGASNPVPITYGSGVSLPSGSNPIGTVGVTALPALPAGPNAIGSVSVSNFPSTQPVSIAGASGTPYQPSTTVGTTSGALTFSPAPTAFIKLCVPSSASNGIWVNWAGAAATASAPSEYMPPGQCDSWIKSTRFLPTGTINAIASASVGVSLIYY